MSIGEGAFYQSGLTNVSIGHNVKTIGIEAFRYCGHLASVIIPDSVINIEGGASLNCTDLTSIYFLGNAPATNTYVFSSGNNLLIYRLPRTGGWASTFDRIPTALWLPQAQVTDARFGVRTNQFGFNINWASDQTVVVEACTNLFHPDWQPVQTNVLTTGSSYFSDPQWTNFPGRFYRLHSL